MKTGGFSCKYEKSLFTIDHECHSIKWIKDFILSLDKNKLISKTRKGVEYYSIPCSFDIETSSFYEADEKRAIMYCWQFSILGHCCMGRTWHEFISLMNYISDTLYLSDERKLVIYVHNLSYEFQFMRFYFDWINVFSLEKRKPIKAEISQNIEFRCSYILSNYSLSNLAKNLTTYNSLSKLIGDLDYSKIRHSKTPLSKKEVGYCINDVLIVVAFIQEEMERLGNITKLPLTKTGYVRRYVRNSVLYGSDKDRYEKKKNFHKYHRLMKALKISADDYVQLLRAFQGGFTHASVLHSNKLMNNVDSFDFTSSYPYVLVSEKFPMSEPLHVKPKNEKIFRDYMKYYCCFFDVEFFGLSPTITFDNYISESKCFEKRNVTSQNGRVVSADYIKITVTEIDFDIIERFYTYDHMRVSNMKIMRKAYLPKELIKSILFLYQDKTKLKGVDGEEVNYMQSKGMLNSVYGMMVTAIVKAETTYTNNEWGETPPNFDAEIEKYNDKKNRFLFYPWGVWCTAYARRNLISGILEFREDYIYSDTDSIKCLNAKKHMKYINRYNNICDRKMEKVAKLYDIDISLFAPVDIKGIKHPLGYWDFETKNKQYQKFKTLGAKRYMYFDDKLHITVSGIGKKIGCEYIEKNFDDPFKAFADGLEIPKGETGKMIHTYIDKPISGIVSDYNGVKCRYSEMSYIHMEDAEYSLSISDRYMKYLMEVDDFEIH